MAPLPDDPMFYVIGAVIFGIGIWKIVFKG